MNDGQFHTAVFFDLRDQDDLERRFQKAIASFEDIDGLSTLSFGKDDRGRAKPFTHAMIAHFEDRDAYDRYLTHPLHLAVVELIQQEEVSVSSISFWPDVVGR